ncbi:MAG: neutral/alkaline non-lysosomal ceramidase N-terminal domain-containing protein [Chitinophagaceae bacterium]|jgi:hypothetical protein
MKFYLLFLILLCSHTSLHSQEFIVGAASRSINPDKDSLYIAGGKPNRLFIDVHDSLYVKAVYIENISTHVVLLTFDCIGLMYPTLLEIRDEVKRSIPAINPSNIVMSSTHTHSGPDVVGIWGKNYSSTGVNEKHMGKIVKMAVISIKEAFEKRKSATMEYAMGVFGKNWVKNISEPDEIDRELSSIRFKDENYHSIATLTNFACHPTIMDDASTSASADYLWGYYNYLDSIQGGVNMFFQGSIGGWIQPEDVPSSFENAMYYGKSLGNYVYSILSNSTINLSGKLEIRSKTVSLPMKNPIFSMLSKDGVIKRNFGDNVISEIITLRIGDAQFASHPGETVPAMSIATKKLMEAKGPKFIMGLSQDALGYILKPSFFIKENNIPHSEYLTGMSIGPDTMKIIMETLKELLIK